MLPVRPSTRNRAFTVTRARKRPPPRHFDTAEASAGSCWIGWRSGVARLRSWLVQKACSRFGDDALLLRLTLRRQVDALDPPIFLGKQVVVVLRMLLSVADRDQV